MVKIAVVGDLHFGIKDGSYNSFLYQKHFFTNVFFKNIMEKNYDIDCIVFLGDIFHNRRIVNMRILSETIKLFNGLQDDIDKGLNTDYMPFYFVTGNHDLYFRNEYNTAAVKDILYKNAIYGDNDYCMINDDCIIIHWKNTADEYKEVFEKIKANEDTNKITYIFGHFAVLGSLLLVNKVNDNESDLRKESFLNYFPNIKKVFSGHFHIPSDNGYVKYTGVPFQLTWNEADVRTGFYIVDTNKELIEFVENPFKIFKTVRLNKDNLGSNFIDEQETEYKLTYKIIYNGSEFEEKAKEIYSSVLNKGHEALLIDESVYNISENDDEINGSINDISTLIKEYFKNSKQIPEGESEFYYDIFKTFFDEVKRTSENIEL